MAIAHTKRSQHIVHTQGNILIFPGPKKLIAEINIAFLKHSGWIDACEGISSIAALSTNTMKPKTCPRKRTKILA